MDVQSAPNWGLSRRVLFRLCFCFFVLINFPFPLTIIPGAMALMFWYLKAVQAVALWAGKTVFHLSSVLTAQNGSGDKTIDYLTLFCFLVITVVVTLIWSVLDRKRRHYWFLSEFLTIYVRFALAVALMTYGMFKVIPSQFPVPSARVLMETYGESSPMRLLWTFMGYSPAYSIFAGLCELTAGLLLVWRRTVPLGAALGCAVLLNIVMLNFCYDVPVKIYSCELLVEALFLLSPHARRLADAFLLNRPTKPMHDEPRFQRRHFAIAHLAAKLTMVLLVVTTIGFRSYTQQRRMQSSSLKPPLLRRGFHWINESPPNR